MAHSVYSYDVFDTCIARVYARPTDLFFDLAQRIFKLHKLDFNQNTLNRFVKNRIRAERSARYGNKAGEDINIFDIYSAFDNYNEWSFETDILIREEINLEGESIYPVMSILEDIKQKRKAGGRIIFLSDMYLPKDFIFETLKNFEIAEYGDPFYLSNDIGYAKSTGNLYKYVLVHENVSPEQVFHTGDNRKTDVEIPEWLGITAKHFSCSAISKIELDFLGGNRTDINRSSKTIGGVRRARLSDDRLLKEDGATIDFIYRKIAPFLVAYVAWVLRQARQNSIGRLYFVARDGQILKEIASRLPDLSLGIELEYLYGSRQAWNLASVINCNRAELDWLIHPHDSKSLEEILYKLDLSYSEVRDEFAETIFDAIDPGKQLDNREITEFWSIIQKPGCSRKILEKSAKRRVNALQYFHGMGMLGNEKWAIVDTGWRLTGQRSLAKVLQHGGYQGHIQGYYIGIRKDHVLYDKMGSCSAFISPEQLNMAANTESHWLYETGVSTVIENVFTMADHSLVVDYQDDGACIVPRFDDMAENKFKKYYLPLLKESVNRFTNIISESGMLQDESDLLTKLAVTETSAFFQKPEKHMVAVISGMQVNTEQSHLVQNQRLLVSPLTMQDLLRMIFFIFSPNRKRFIDPAHVWYRGSAALSACIHNVEN